MSDSNPYAPIDPTPAKKPVKLTKTQQVALEAEQAAEAKAAAKAAREAAKAAKTVV